MRCVKITVTGLVQGIGYRPFVAELAESCGIGGQVKNVGGIVKIVAAGKPEALERFLTFVAAFSLSMMIYFPLYFSVLS